MQPEVLWRFLSTQESELQMRDLSQQLPSPTSAPELCDREELKLAEVSHTPEARQVWEAQAGPSHLAGGAAAMG